MDLVLYFMIFTRIFAVSLSSICTSCQFYNHCRCCTDENRLNVDCSRRNITKLPRFPSSVTSIHLEYNFIEIIRDRIFENLAHLKELDLSSNEIWYLGVKAFIGLGNLQRLILQDNRLEYNVLSFPEGIFKPLASLTYLNVKFSRIFPIPQFPGEVISDLPMLESLEIDLYDTDIPIGFAKGFSLLTNLKRLRTGTCFMLTVNNNTFYNLPYLEYIDLSNCTIQTYSYGTLYNRTNLKYLDVSNIMLDIKNIQKLVYDLRSSTIQKIVMTNTLRHADNLPQDFFILLSNTGIQELFLNKNNFVEAACDWSFCGNLPSTLRILDFSYNKLTRFWYDIQHLYTLNLKHNSLSGFLTSNTYMQSNETEIKSIDLSYNGISNLIFSIFHNHSRLETINLSNNILSDVTFDLSQTKSLRVLDLSSNNIKVLSKRTMDAITNIAKKSNVKIDLSNNILRCSCETVHFLQWMLDYIRIFHNSYAYKCVLDNGSIVVLKHFRQTVLQLDKKCTSYTVLIISISIGIVTSFIIVTTGLLYRYRWKLRYIYYMTKSKYYRYKPAMSEQVYTYNAFISYSDCDRNFIVNECVPNLEQNGNIKLCIHQRDFLPGEEITVNIANAIHESKKTICVISRSFLESYYCMFEFNIARMESIYSRNRQNILFLVFYEQILPRELPLVMLELVQQQSYIEYPNDEQGNVVFWQKIREAVE